MHQRAPRIAASARERDENSCTDIKYKGAAQRLAANKGGREESNRREISVERADKLRNTKTLILRNPDKETPGGTHTSRAAWRPDDDECPVGVIRSMSLEFRRR